jgi:xylitol oxidase
MGVVAVSEVGLNWSRTYAYRAPAYERPESVAQLCEVVAGAERVGVLGTRHSFNDIADTPGLLVGLDRLPAEFDVDTAAATARVSGQLRYGDIAHRLDEAGFALGSLASLPHISVAGACATATHGSGDTSGNLATSVVEMDLVLGDGEQVSLRAGDADFPGAVVHLGALGVVTSVTLKLVPSFDVAQVVYDDLDWDVAVDNLDEITSAAHSVSLFTDLRSPRFNVWLKTTDVDHPPEAIFGAQPAREQRHPVPGGAHGNATQQLGVPGPWYDRLPHFRLEFTPSSGEEIQSEYFVPRAKVSEALAVLRKLGPQLAPVLQVCEMRTVAGDDLWLSMAYGGDCVGFHFTWHDHPEDIAAVLPLLEEHLLELGTRPHWGKVFALGREQIAASYPRMADFRSLAARLDPDRVFSNDYLQRLVLAD